MSTASFVISVLAFLVSGGSLGWNVVNHLLTGQRAKLSVISMRLVVPGGKDMEPVLQMTVSATGRVPVEVTGWSLAFPDSLHLHSVLIEHTYSQFDSVYLGDKMPKTIQPGSSGSFNLQVVAAENAAKKNGLDLSKGHLHVYFAARKPLRDKKSVAERLKTKQIKGNPADE